MHIEKTIKYQNTMREIVTRAKVDTEFNEHIWRSPVEVLTFCGLCELDIVHILRDIQRVAPIPEIAFDQMYHQLTKN